MRISLKHLLARLMSVETWDGRTKYKVEESSKEETDRLDQWEKYLQEGEEGKEGVTE